jgi:hypothetical protein
MKKLSIILLALLIVFSFSSCEKDKTEDVISAYENYYKVSAIDKNAYNLFSSSLNDDTDSLDLTPAAVDMSDFRTLLNSLGLSDDSLGESITPSGNIKGTIQKRNKNLTFDVKISYTVADGAKELTITGTYFNEQGDTGTGPATARSTSCAFKINGTDYAVSCKIDENGKCTSASVNGTDVDVRLINSGEKIK